MLYFFVDPFKFDLYENLKRTDITNLSFILSVHLFVLDLCNVKSSFMRSRLRNTALRFLLHNLAIQV